MIEGLQDVTDWDPICLPDFEDNLNLLCTTVLAMIGNLESEHINWTKNQEHTLKIIKEFCKKLQKVKGNAAANSVENRVYLYRLTYRITCASQFFSFFGETPSKALHPQNVNSVKAKLGNIIGWDENANPGLLIKVSQATLTFLQATPSVINSSAGGTHDFIPNLYRPFCGGWLICPECFEIQIGPSSYSNHNKKHKTTQTWENEIAALKKKPQKWTLPLPDTLDERGNPIHWVCDPLDPTVKAHPENDQQLEVIWENMKKHDRQVLLKLGLLRHLHGEAVFVAEQKKLKNKDKEPWASYQTLLKAFSENSVVAQSQVGCSQTP